MVFVLRERARPCHGGRLQEVVARLRVCEVFPDSGLHHLPPLCCVFQADDSGLL